MQPLETTFRTKLTSKYSFKTYFLDITCSQDCLSNHKKISIFMFWQLANVCDHSKRTVSNRVF